MSDDDPFSEVDPVDPADDDIEAQRRELAQRKRGLADLADELDEREAELDDRERELRRREKELDERETELDARVQRIEDGEAELDQRESVIEERERELDERAKKLNEKERTLEEYVGENLREPIEEAMAEVTTGGDSSNRLGTIGSLVLGLVGVTLIVGGVLHGFTDQIAAVPALFASDAANLGVTVLLLFSGLAANLAAVAD